MGREMGNDWRQELASALEWWRDAGVDTLVEDEPRDWLARPAPRVEAVAEAEPAVAAAALPDSLEAFVEYRMTGAVPEAEWLTPRIAPKGQQGAALMILTDMPEPEDAETGVLVSGAPGRLLDRMLAAIGTSRDSAYIASLRAASDGTDSGRGRSQIDRIGAPPHRAGRAQKTASARPSGGSCTSYDERFSIGKWRR
jgi:uracil-DNA glycosylase